jgi:hypothetical protein
MRWSDERYVRLYTRDTIEWTMLPWEARALFPLLLRKVDRAGLLDLGKHGAKGLAVTVGLPIHVVEPGLAGLLEDGCVVQNGTVVLVKNFIEAQETVASNAQRCKEYRARQRAAARDRVASDTSQPDATQNDIDDVASDTKNVASDIGRPAATRSDTPICSDPIRAVKEPTAPKLAVGLPEPEAESEELNEPPMPPGLHPANGFPLTGTNCGAPDCGLPQYETPTSGHLLRRRARRRTPGAEEAAPLANMPAHAITRLAEQGSLTGELLAAIMRQKKLGKKRRPLYDAAVSGTALRLRGQYIARRCSASKESRRAVEKACERRRAHLRRAAENVLELGCTVEHYLDVAFDTKPMKLAFPPLPHLSGR